MTTTYVSKMGQTSPATKPLEVIDVVRAASAEARESGEEPSTVPSEPAPTRAEVLAHRESSGGWNDNRPIEAIDVIRTASANAREREA